MKRILLKTFPYISSLLAAVLFYLISVKINSLRDLFVDISATFLAIPFIYLFYQATQKISNRKLNKEIFDYAKMQIDREVLSILNHLSKIIFGINNIDYSTERYKEILSLDRNKIKQIVFKKEYLGFQLFKRWEHTESNLHDLLKNPFILEKMENDQIISILKLIKNLRFLERYIRGNKDFYIDTRKKEPSFIIANALEVSKYNYKLPHRYLLMRKTNKEDLYVVVDFGDFDYPKDRLLNLFKINTKYLDLYAETIEGVINQINKWLDLTGKEILIDTKIFRIYINHEPQRSYIN